MLCCCSQHTASFYKRSCIQNIDRIHFIPSISYLGAHFLLILKVLVTTSDAQWEGMGDIGSVRYEPALLPPCPAIRVLSYSNK